MSLLPATERLTVEFLGQACVLISFGAVKIVCDPWFSGGSHLDSWLPYPCYSPSDKKEIWQKIEQATHIYISHDHEDHFDPTFLKTLSRKKILVGQFYNDKFLQELRALEGLHELQFLEHKEKLALSAGFEVQIFLEQPEFRTNSMMLFKSECGNILNGNDCRPDSDILAEIAKSEGIELFLYTLNFMANGYPFPYLRKADKDLSERITAVRQEVKESFASSMRILKPALSAAFAGPVIFRDRINDHLNMHPESRDWTGMLEELRAEGDVVWPALYSMIALQERSIASMDIKSWNLDYRPEPENIPLCRESAYEGCGIEREEIYTAAVGFWNLLAPMLQATRQISGLPLVLSAVPILDDLESSATLWSVKIDLDSPVPSVIWLESSLEPPFLEIVSTPAILLQFLQAQISVDALLLSSRARFKREPDEFNLLLHNILRFGLDPSSRQALVRWMQSAQIKKETMMVESAGKTWCIPKYCPHEGESFETAKVTPDGKIVCSRHKWVFDLETGRCIIGDPSVTLSDSLERVNPDV